MALSPGIPQDHPNLTTAEMPGLSPEEVLQLHLEQMEEFAPDFALRTLEHKITAIYRQTF